MQEYRHNDPLAIWKQFPVPYAYEPIVSSGMRKEIDKCFEIYNQLKPGLFENGVLPKIKVSMDNLGSRGGTLARATWTYTISSLSITRGTITFDTNESWAWLSQESCGAYDSTYDIGNVGVHEIGHLMGLAHAPSNPLQTMYATTSPGARTVSNCIFPHHSRAEPSSSRTVIVDTKDLF